MCLFLNGEADFLTYNRNYCKLTLEKKCWRCASLSYGISKFGISGQWIDLCSWQCSTIFLHKIHQYSRHLSSQIRQIKRIIQLQSIIKMDLIWILLKQAQNWVEYFDMWKEHSDHYFQTLLFSAWMNEICH